ncbi:MAG: hypothetical protein WCQ61_07135, partial [Proteiniphilum sp.]
MKDSAEILYALVGCGVGSILACIVVSLYWKLKTVSKRDFEIATQENYRLNTQLAVSKEKISDVEQEI